MRVSLTKTTLVLVLAGILSIVWVGVAWAAPPWSDAPNSWWVSSYGVTEAEVGTVAEGYPDGTFRPGLAVTRAQFAKMAVSGLGVPTSNPSTPTFKDVARGGIFYQYIEGAYLARLIGGYALPDGLYYRPDNSITRQQANSILGRYLSQFEISTTGSIHGDVTNYGTLEMWYNAEGSFYLNGFDDAHKVAADHRATTAYLIRRGIVKGSSSKLNPLTTLVRSQAAVLVLRVKAEAEAIATPPPAPSNLGVAATGAGSVVNQTDTAEYAGNDPTPQVTGDTLASSDIAIYDAPFYGDAYIKLDSSNSSGKFYTDLDDPSKPLVDGSHGFTARVKNENGLVSPPSDPVTYILDTVLPTGSITTPTLLTGKDYAAANEARPAFTASVTDDRSGVASVRFQVSVDQTPLVWQSISTDTEPDIGTDTYAAVWPTTGALGSGLSDGQYQLRIVITDVAGNERIVGPMKLTVDTVRPTVSIAAPIPGTDLAFYTEDGSTPFTASAIDMGSGIDQVDFYYAPWSEPGPTTWGGFTWISSDDTVSYNASYPSGGLAEGHYIYAVRATDLAGNQSALTDGSGYVAWVTQEVIIDWTPPDVTIETPDPGQKVPENQLLNIAWTLDDVTPPDTVKIEYTLNGADLLPFWVEITAATPNDGSYEWTTPDVTGDNVNVRIRITATDKAGPKVGDVPGHTSATWSGLFTVYDLPEAASAVAATDPDTTNPGVDGRDFSASWTPSVSPDIVEQRVYILPATAGLNLISDHPVWTFLNNVTASWAGTASLTKDSQGAGGFTLTTGSYKIWIVVVDTSGQTASVSSDSFEVADP